MNRCTLPLALVLSACGADPQLVLPSQADIEQPTVVLVTPNLDDDDFDGAADWSQGGGVEDDNDRSTLQVLNKNRDSTLTYFGEEADIRVWFEGRQVLGEGVGLTWALPERDKKDGITVQIEARTWGGLGELVVTDDKKEESARISVIGSPPTIGHHLLPSRDLWIVDTDFGGGYNNQVMVDALRAEFGDTFFVVDGSTVGEDQWMQDEPEFLRMWSPESSTTLILDSIRDGNGWGGLDPFPESIAGGDVWVDTYGPGNRDATTYDAFGNLEASPPIDGYPLGRAYYGWNEKTGPDDEGPHPDMRSFLASLSVQEPFVADTSWLCVGHIDEVTSFVPDPSAPRGFRFLIADTTLGWELMASQDGATRLDRHGRSGDAGHSRGTFGDYSGDLALKGYNEDMQADHLDPILATFREELNLTDDEIIRIPSLFEEVFIDGFLCGAAAVVPGTVNLLMVTNEDGTGGTAVIPDPFLRPPGASQDDDPLIAAWKELLPSGVRPVFVDDWNMYHMQLGEVHCGTNQVRDPAMAANPSMDWLKEVTQ
ncbi:MAG: protein-arginine deiminase family protein [Myxococcota bacterium]